jgi:hypothetical protein
MLERIRSSEEDRLIEKKLYAMIAEAAYFRAEKRGFRGDRQHQLEDWFVAEQEINQVLQIQALTE